jgi:hypothetical protein
VSVKRLPRSSTPLSSFDDLLEFLDLLVLLLDDDVQLVHDFVTVVLELLMVNR